MATLAPPDVERFRSMKGRITDFYEHNADSIRRKATLMATAKIFEEMAWLVSEIKRLGGQDAIEEKDRFKKIAAFVQRVNTEQRGAIATGQFVKVRADVFGAWRFLLRALEETCKYVLDSVDALALMEGGHVPDEHGDRIVLDLEEGLGDPDEE